MSIELIQGDCLEKMQDIPDKSIDFILTDPPYGTTACSWDTIIPLESMWKQVKRVIKDNGAIALFSSQPFTTVLIGSNMKMFRYCWYWDRCMKSNFLNAEKQPIRHIEGINIFYEKQCGYFPILSNKRKDQIRYNNIKHKGNNVQTMNNIPHKLKGRFDHRKIPLDKDYPTHFLSFALPSPNKGRYHPTQKPVKLLEYLIKTYTLENETVLDFTMGSGSTGVACIETNRNFIGIELDEKYFKVATDRIDKAKQSPKLFN